MTGFTWKEIAMARQKNYKKTLTACYLGFVTQSISANFAPLLFLTFQSTYGITLEKIALIPMVFYLAQLFIDLAATRFADRIGYRTCVVVSQRWGLCLWPSCRSCSPSPSRAF